jgi:hypothetical protein
VGRCKAGSYILIFTPWACFFPGRLPVLSPFVSGSHEPPFSVGGVYYTAAGRETWPPSSEKSDRRRTLFFIAAALVTIHGAAVTPYYFSISLFISFFIMPGRAIHFPRSRPREFSRGLFLFDRGGSGTAGSYLRSCRDLHAASVLP